MQHFFGRFYGADLINTFKNGPEYYEHIFADLGIGPTEALFRWMVTNMLLPSTSPADIAPITEQVAAIVLRCLAGEAG